MMFFFISPDFKHAFCLSSQTKTHLSALFTWNTGGHWGECSSTQVGPEVPFTLSATAFLCVLAQCNVSPWHSFSVFWGTDGLCVLFFRCRTLSGSPRPKSFKKIHFIKNIRQHDMRNGRYEGKQRHPLVDTSPQWLMAGCPSQWTAVWMFLTLQATS